MFIAIFMTIGPAYSKGGHISLIDYQNDEQLLSVNIVAPVTSEAKLYLSSDGIISELRRFTRVGEYKLVIHLPCSEFRDGDNLLYKAGEVTLSLPLEHISCTTDINQLQQPRIIYSNAGCIIEPKGTTLWRVGSLLAEKNGYSVYQNMYAVFLSNRHQFIGEDITRMQDNLLLCPAEELIASLDKRHSVEMFQEAEAFRLASNMQKGAQARSEEASPPEDSEGGEQLAQVIAPAEAASAEIASVEEVAGQETDAELLAMASVYVSAGDKGQAANAEADLKTEGGDLLVQVIAPAEAASAEIAPAEEVAGQEADAEHLAMASVYVSAGDKVQVANPEADLKAEGGEPLAQGTAHFDVVAGQEHPIVDTTLAVISGGDKDVVPKLVIAIAGGKQAGHLNVVPGCYIEPNNKTLWRVGLALNKLNGHTVYQNMYAVFAVNPKAFPSGNINHMLNQKLRCPSAREVTKHTTQESKALMELDFPG